MQYGATIAPWSFYAIRQCGAGYDDATIAIAEVMTTQGASTLPEGSVECANHILREMVQAGLSNGSGYARLLLLALTTEPLRTSLAQMASKLIATHLCAGRVHQGFAFYDALPNSSQQLIAPELATPIINKAAALFSPDDPAALLRFTDPYRRLPQIKAFDRLPAFCAAVPETLPSADDALMLRSLLRHPDVIGAVKSNVVDRLFARVGKGLPYDLGLARLRLTRLRSANQLGPARILSRQITRHPASHISDLANRIDTLVRLDRLNVIDRYVSKLERFHARGGCDDLELASRLWAAGFPSRALDALGPVEGFIADSDRVDISLRSLHRLRRFGEARELMTQAEGTGIRINKSIARLINYACTYLDARNIRPIPVTDNALEVVRDLVDSVLAKPRSAYQPITRRVLITTQSIAIGGAERQVSGQAVGLAREVDVESVMILANRDSENTYDIPDIGGKLTVRRLEREVPDTTTLSPEGIDLNAVSANFGLATLRRFYHAIIRFRPEIVHVRSGQHIEVALAALMAGAPRIIVHFGSMTRGQQSSGNDINKLREALLERGLAMAARAPQLRLVANSRSAADDWAATMGLDNDQIGIITNCIDADAFIHPPAGAAPGRDELVVGGVFRFAPVKDPLMWVESAAEIARMRPQTRFIMVGDGPMRAAVEVAIDKFGLRDRFTLPGLVTSGVASWLSQMDVFLMTSRTESLPNSVIEAQLMGLPVVAPNVGGISEVFATSESGKACGRNVAELSEAICTYLDDAALRTRVREEAPASILRKFSAARQIEDIRAAYGWQPTK